MALDTHSPSVRSKPGGRPRVEMRLAAASEASAVGDIDDVAAVVVVGIVFVGVDECVAGPDVDKFSGVSCC